MNRNSTDAPPAPPTATTPANAAWAAFYTAPQPSSTNQQPDASTDNEPRAGPSHELH